MDFEFNPEKSAANLEKHGLSLEAAKQLWTVPAVEVEARTVDERRFLRIAKVNEKFYSCVFTVRSDAIRLISARRSRPDEEQLYREKIENEKAK